MEDDIRHDESNANVFNDVVDGYRHKNAGQDGQNQGDDFEESPNK